MPKLPTKYLLILPILMALGIYILQKNPQDSLNEIKSNPQAFVQQQTIKTENEVQNQEAKTLNPQIQALKEILISKNDNDPRLDQEFKNMNAELKNEIQSEYQKLPPEKRNERGLLAFLLARDLKSIEDFEFIEKVFDETPCLSFENCGSREISDPHHSGIDQASLNYPQLTVLYQLQKQYEKNPEKFQNPEMKDRLIGTLKRAGKFPVGIVKNKAQQALEMIEK